MGFKHDFFSIVNGGGGKFMAGGHFNDSSRFWWTQTKENRPKKKRAHKGPFLIFSDYIFSKTAARIFPISVEKFYIYKGSILARTDFAQKIQFAVFLGKFLENFRKKKNSKKYFRIFFLLGIAQFAK